MNRIRVGVIGLGTWGQAHLDTYRDHPGVELAAVCDTDPERLRAAGERCGVEARFADAEELLSCAGLDAVSVVTPDGTHTELILQAIRHGTGVLVEKPLATTLEDCDRIGRALDANPVPFMVDFHNRWNPGVVHMREQLQAGRLGSVRLVYYRLSDTLFVPTQMLPWAAQSSVNWFLGSHCVDTLRWLLADEVSRLYTVSDSTVLEGMGIETPDYFVSVVEMRGGARVLLENCWILPESSPSLVDFKLEVVGERGACHFDGSPHRLVMVTDDGPECPDTFIAPTVHGRRVGFATESIRHFADCLIGGREPSVGFKDGRQATRILLAMERSVNERRPVDL